MLVVTHVHFIIYGILVCLKEKAIALEDSSLFESILKSSMFIDKTLLLKEILNGEPVISITAPRKFGKSTNLDMIKRFLEIRVDNYGNPLPVTKSSNYKLFKERDLDIFQDVQFCEEHFGLYPVIYIDYGPILDIRNLEDFLKKITKVISETFSPHEYLLHNKTLWANNSEINLFEGLISAEVKKEQIQHSFKWLCNLLQRHFGRKVFILIDESDAVVESLIFTENNDLFEITKLVRETETNLLKSNDRIGALLVGVLRVFRGSCDKDISYYPFLADQNYGKFFGITQGELDNLLKRLITDEKKLAETSRRIDHFYNGYTLYPGGKTTIYSTWPVLNFLETDTHASDYLCKSEYLYSFKRLCSVYGLTEWLQNLLLDKEVRNTHVELHKPLFHRRHILMLNFAVKYKIVDQSKNTTKVFLTALYHLGYLTPLDGKLRTFKLANEGVRKELRYYTPERPIDPLADI